MWTAIRVKAAVILIASLAFAAHPPQNEIEAEAEKGKKVNVTESGFLGDYSDLSPHPKQNMMVWHKRDGILAEYDSLLIEQPLIYFQEESKAALKGVDPGELKMLSDSLREAVIETLEEGGYEIAEAAGPRVLVVRSAITDVDPVDPKKNLGTKVAGAALGIGLITPRADLGRAAIEVEMLDGETGERVAAVVAARKASRFGGTIKGSKRWGDVKAAFKKWAKQFRNQLDDLRKN